ncbi:phosphoglycerate dehydrogenase [Geovibrio ferrireducens]|jgi:D-3-phosphoglycerate dehydrogenase|uniref:phosphoglycerate dehydrogenase n=1 Tax=Geovibrio ferrireducens TaxID=46201 RepID=UPI002245589D|nr:phosphoglycerate dehydrogenase [Geovibrio ferrireducens]
MPTETGVTTVAFSKCEYLRRKAEEMFGGVIFNPFGRRLTFEELTEIYRDCTALIVGLDKIDGKTLKALPKLKAVAKYGVGLDNIDLAACAERGVQVFGAEGVNRRSVAELVLGFMLGHMRNIFASSLRMRGGDWVKNGGCELSGKTVGIIGTGNIGREVVMLLKPFGCRILCNDILPIDDFCAANGALPASKEEIFRSADVVSLHVPLTAETRNMINEQALRLMKPSALLINTSRGGVVDTDAVKTALKENRLGGACFDVYDTEPFYDVELCGMENVVCTPHIGGNSEEAVRAMGEAALRALSGCRGV